MKIVYRWSTVATTDNYFMVKCTWSRAVTIIVQFLCVAFTHLLLCKNLGSFLWNDWCLPQSEKKVEFNQYSSMPRFELKQPQTRIQTLCTILQCNIMQEFYLQLIKVTKHVMQSLKTCHAMKIWHFEFLESFKSPKSPLSRMFKFLSYDIYI